MISRSKRRMSEGLFHNRNWNTVHRVVLILAAVVSGYLLLAGIDSGPRVLGRLHPFVVHLPVGILLLATALAVGSRTRKWEFLGDSLPAILALGTWSALLAVVTGSILASTGGYNETILDRHKLLGALLALLNLLIYLLVASASSRQVQTRNRLLAPLLCGGALLLLATGHAGGALTHGPDYLTSVLPEPIKQLFGNGGESVAGFDFEKGRLYDSLIAPVLHEQCAECHGQGRSKGGLRIDTFEMLLKGGESGPVVIPGKPGLSELLRRITLSPYHEDHMPPDERPPLTIAQTELIRWWIQEGASPEQSLVEASGADMPSSVRTVFNRLAPPDEPGLLDKVADDLPPPRPDVLNKLRSRGVAVKYLSEKGVRLDVSYSRLKGPLAREDLEPLRSIAANVAWLDLSGHHFAPGSLEILADLSNLQRLHLEQSSITNQQLGNLIHLQNLEYLNLYGTSISDEGTRFLAKLGALRWLFLWQSSVSQKGAGRLREDLPELKVNLGSELQVVKKKSDK